MAYVAPPAYPARLPRRPPPGIAHPSRPPRPTTLRHLPHLRAKRPPSPRWPPRAVRDPAGSRPCRTRAASSAGGPARSPPPLRQERERREGRGGAAHGGGRERPWDTRREEGVEDAIAPRLRARAGGVAAMESRRAHILRPAAFHVIQSMAAEIRREAGERPGPASRPLRPRADGGRKRLHAGRRLGAAVPGAPDEFVRVHSRDGFLPERPVPPPPACARPRDPFVIEPQGNRPQPFSAASNSRHSPALMPEVSCVTASPASIRRRQSIPVRENCTAPSRYSSNAS